MKSRTIAMFEEEKVPPELWSDAQAVNTTIAELSVRITARQKLCEHNWRHITWRDPEYYTRIDRSDIGRHAVIKESRCTICNLRRVFDGLPFNVCHKCGGKMKMASKSHYDGIPIFVRNCEDCNHEYHST